MTTFFLRNLITTIFKVASVFLFVYPSDFPYFESVFIIRLGELKEEKGWDSEEMLYQNLWSKLKLGVHYDVEVTAKDWGQVLSNSPQLRLTQVQFNKLYNISYKCKLLYTELQVLCHLNDNDYTDIV